MLKAIIVEPITEYRRSYFDIVKAFCVIAGCDPKKIEMANTWRRHMTAIMTNDQLKAIWKMAKDNKFDIQFVEVTTVK